MGTLKQQYEADGMGEHVHVGSPETRADNLAESAPQKDPGPEDLSPDAEAWQRHAAPCRDLLAGSVTGYLTQWEAEEDADFANRKRDSVFGFVNFYEEAVSGLVDQVFQRNLRLEGAPPTIEEFFADVSIGRSAVSGTAFARHAADISLGQGGTPLILIDHPTRDAQASDKAEETAQGLAPYLHLISAWRLIAVGEDAAGNLDQVRYASAREEKAGEWGRKVTPTIVVLERGEEGGYATRRELVMDEESEEFKEDEDAFRVFEPPATASAEIRKRFREIPVVGMPTGAPHWFAPCVLRNVAMLNLLHYRKRTDYDRAEAVASVPMSAWYGWSEDELASSVWGPHFRAATSKSPQEAAVADISFGFATAEISLKTLESIERYIAVKSKDPQSQRATGEEKSTIRMLDEAKKISRLQAWALGWLNAMQEALVWAGAWLGIDEASVGALSYLDEVFDSLAAAPNWADFIQFAALVDLPADVQIEEAQRYGVLSDTYDAREIAERIVTAGPGLIEDDED